MTSEGSRKGAAKKSDGFYPPNPKQWARERNGLGLRSDLDLGISERLSVRDAFARLPGDIQVWRSSDVACAQKYLNLFHGVLSATWSAFALPCPDGGVVVVFNETHSKRRRRATLMEEFFHLRLGHPPSTLRIYAGGEPRRTFNSKIEEEAYESGAASLVPYKGLKALVAEGLTPDQIAQRFDVSTQLVEFRAKVTKLYRKLRR